MCFGCLWCFKMFIKSEDADLNNIDFTVYKDRSLPEVEKEIRAWKKTAPKCTIIDICRRRVIPPVLHSKIKIGNELFNRLSSIGDSLPEFRAVVTKWKLNVDRKKENIIYARFHGNDIKRMCRSISDLAGTFLLPFYFFRSF